MGSLLAACHQHPAGKNGQGEPNELPPSVDLRHLAYLDGCCELRKLQIAELPSGYNNKGVMERSYTARLHHGVFSNQDPILKAVCLDKLTALTHRTLRTQSHKQKAFAPKLISQLLHVPRPQDLQPRNLSEVLKTQAHNWIKFVGVPCKVKL